MHKFSVGVEIKQDRNVRAGKSFCSEDNYVSRCVGRETRHTHYQHNPHPLSGWVEGGVLTGNVDEK